MRNCRLWLGAGVLLVVAAGFPACGGDAGEAGADVAPVCDVLNAMAVESLNSDGYYSSEVSVLGTEADEELLSSSGERVCSVLIGVPENSESHGWRSVCGDREGNFRYTGTLRDAAQRADLCLRKLSEMISDASEAEAAAAEKSRDAALFITHFSCETIFEPAIEASLRTNGIYALLSDRWVSAREMKQGDILDRNETACIGSYTRAGETRTIVVCGTDGNNWTWVSPGIAGSTQDAIFDCIVNLKRQNP